jgi:hypothetical protein
MVRRDGAGCCGRCGLPLIPTRLESRDAADLELGVSSPVVASGAVDVWRGSNV